MITENLTYADLWDLDALGDNAPLPPAFCDIYKLHGPHAYQAINGRSYSCPGYTAEDQADDEAEANAEPCEHGLSAALCAGPMHYPDDRYDW